MRQAIALRQHRLETAGGRLNKGLLAAQLARGHDRLADAMPRLEQALRRFIAHQQHRVENVGGQLEAYRQAVAQVLARGYAIVRDATGKVIDSAHEIAAGDALTLIFHDGKISVTAEDAAKQPRAAAEEAAIARPGIAAMRLAAAVIFAALIAAPCWAGTLTLDGEVEQGGLVRGKTDPGAQVTLDGRAIRVAPDGGFIFGFGRDAPDRAALDVTFADGSHDHRDLAVQARHYDVQRINGLPEQQVSPDAVTLERIKREGAVIAACPRRRHRSAVLRGAAALAGDRPDLRRLWQPAHPQRRAARAAWRRRCRRRPRLADRRRRRRHGDAGRARSLLYRRHRHHRSRLRSRHDLSAHGPRRCDGWAARRRRRARSAWSAPPAASPARICTGRSTGTRCASIRNSSPGRCPSRADRSGRVLPLPSAIDEAIQSRGVIEFRPHREHLDMGAPFGGQAYRVLGGGDERGMRCFGF